MRIARPCSWPSSTRQALIGVRAPDVSSTTTVQAPQSPSAQPSFVPVSPAGPRSQSSSEMVGEVPAGSVCGRLFSVKAMDVPVMRES